MGGDSLGAYAWLAGGCPGPPRQRGARVWSSAWARACGGPSTLSLTDTGAGKRFAVITTLRRHTDGAISSRPPGADSGCHSQSRQSNSRLPTTLHTRDQPPAELSHQAVSGLTGTVHLGAFSFRLATMPMPAICLSHSMNHMRDSFLATSWGQLGVASAPSARTPLNKSFIASCLTAVRPCGV